MSEFKRCYRCKQFYGLYGLDKSKCSFIESGQISSCNSFVEYEALKNLRETHHKWFKYEDETLLDLCLAIKLHSKDLRTKWLTPLWLMIISASGQRKSRTIESFFDAQKTYLMNYITPNTFISGWKKQSKNDLCNRLLNEDIKLVLTGDMAQFVKMNYETKCAIWSQLREGYYGRFQKKTGSGVDIIYEGVLFDWLACSTPIIDEDLIMKENLGSRELCLRIPDENEDLKEREKLMLKVWENSENEKLRETELKQAIKIYFIWQENNREELDKIVISDEIRDRIFSLAYFITQLRATAESDPYSGDLLNFVYPEAPTRILEQLKMMFIYLKQIDYGYSDEDVMKRLFEITKSSIHPIRLKILKALYPKLALSTTKLAYKVGLAFKATNRELQICKQLGIVESTQEQGQGGSAFIWTLNDDHEIVKLLPKLCSDLEPQQTQTTLPPPSTEQQKLGDN